MDPKMIVLSKNLEKNHIIPSENCLFFSSTEISVYCIAMLMQSQGIISVIAVFLNASVFRQIDLSK